MKSVIPCTCRYSPCGIPRITCGEYQKYPIIWSFWLWSAASSCILEKTRSWPKCQTFYSRVSLFLGWTCGDPPHKANLFIVVGFFAALSEIRVAGTWLAASVPSWSLVTDLCYPTTFKMVLPSVSLTLAVAEISKSSTSFILIESSIVDCKTNSSCVLYLPPGCRP